MITIEKVAREDQYILHNLMQFYIYEFSQYLTSIKLESNGSYMPFQLEDYWVEDHLHPFFIKKGEEFIGFALVESESLISPNTIHEFFIIAKYKGRGFGKIAATEIFHLFPGSWMITQVHKNYPAQAFWRGLLFNLTEGNVKESYDKERRSVQEFHTDSIKSNVE
jgi:predicted acetyltransferase